MWKEGIAEIVQGEPTPIRTLGAIEDRLLRFLQSGPKDKFELAEHLYGTSIDCETIINRTKRVLNRIRCKNPSLIVYGQGRYLITDLVYLEEFLGKAI